MQVYLRQLDHGQISGQVYQSQLCWQVLKTCLKWSSKNSIEMLDTKIKSLSIFEQNLIPVYDVDYTCDNFQTFRTSSMQYKMLFLEQK